MEDYNGLATGFHRISSLDRLSRIQKYCDLTNEEVNLLSGKQPLSPRIADHLIENVVGYFSIPLGIGVHFEIDGESLFIPMAVEETSIIAAASSTAKWIKKMGGKIQTQALGRRIIGQIQIPKILNDQKTEIILKRLNEEKNNLIEKSNRFLPGLLARGGGVEDIEFRVLKREDDEGSMLVIHLLCDPCDAMGANLINQVCEGIKPEIEFITGEKVGLCILSNLVDGKLVQADIEVPDVDVELAKGIEEATVFAKTDPYRAATHNKGVLNGIDPILIATGNDWRAVEAGIHAYASRSGRYQPVTDWWREGNTLRGRFVAPIAVGIVGGVTKVHPVAQIALKILKADSAEKLSRVCAAVGLVQNLGALKALSTVGIVKGHMQLHTTNLALAAGANVEEKPQLKERLAEVLRVEKCLNLTRAKEVLEAFRGSRSEGVSL